MRKFVIIASLAAWVAIDLHAADLPRDFGRNVAVIASAGREGLGRDTVVGVLFAAATELRVSDRVMPRIVVVSATRQDAAAGDATGSARIFVQKHDASGETVYEAWVIQNEESKLIQVLVTVLNDAFSLGLSPGEIDKRALRIRRREKLLVSVRSFETKPR